MKLSGPKPPACLRYELNEPVSWSDLSKKLAVQSGCEVSSPQDSWDRVQRSLKLIAEMDGRY